MVGSPRSRKWIVVALLVAAVGIAYSNAPRAALVLDGPALLEHDLRIRGWDAARLHDILFGDYWGAGRRSGLYRPLTTLSYLVDGSVFGHESGASGHVLVNVALHALNVLLLHSILRRIGASMPAALAAALLWAVHPLGTEAVTNAIGRADVLAAFGVLSGWRLHAAGGSAAFSVGRRIGLLAASTIAIAAKESGIVLIALLGLHDLVLLEPWQARAGDRIRWWLRRCGNAYSWCLVPVALWIVLRAMAIERADPPAAADNPLVLLNGLAGSAAAAALLIRYLRLVVWPVRLSADYSWNQLPVTTSSFTILGVFAAAILLATVLAAWRARRRSPVVALLVLACFVAIAPVSNVFVRIGTIFGERLAYLPSAAILALAGLAFGAVVRGAARAARLKLASLALTIAAALLATRTILRNRDWRSPLELFASDVRVAPNSFKTNNSYAAELFRDAERNGTLRDRIDAILRSSARAKEIVETLPIVAWPSDVLANHAAFLRAKASLVPADEAASWREMARREYENALQMEAEVGAASPRTGAIGNWRLRKGLADVLRESGDAAGALAEFERAAALAPGPEVLLDRATALREAGRAREALLSAMRVVLLDPTDAKAWDEVERDGAALEPAEPVVVRAQDGSRRFDTRLPGVRDSLEEAAREQYAAILGLGQRRAAEGFRQSVRRAIGIELEAPSRAPGAAH